MFKCALPSFIVIELASENEVVNHTCPTNSWRRCGLIFGVNDVAYIAFYEGLHANYWGLMLEVFQQGFLLLSLVAECRVITWCLRSAVVGSCDLQALVFCLIVLLFAW